MLLFGHTGITTGIVKVCDILSSINRTGISDEPDSSSRFSLTAPKKWLPPHHWLNKVRHQLGSIDYRLVLLGSLLPDILDKPWWLFAASNIFPSGRGYGHTFLFNLLLFTGGLMLIKYKKSWLLIIPFSSIVHLILDQMWDNPVNLWWPLLRPFQRVETTGWLANVIQALFSEAGVYIPEMIGLLIILLMGYRLIVRKNIISFIRTGDIA